MTDYNTKITRLWTPLKRGVCLDCKNKTSYMLFAQIIPKDFSIFLQSDLQYRAVYKICKQCYDKKDPTVKTKFSLLSRNLPRFIKHDV